MTDIDLKNFSKIADNLGLDYIMEVHDKDELQRVSDFENAIIGVNNRNLKLLKLNIKNSITLRQQFDKDNVFVSESGIKSKKTLKNFKKITLVFFNWRKLNEWWLFWNLENGKKKLFLFGGKKKRNYQSCYWRRKTFFAIHCLKRYLENDPQKSILIVVPSIALLDQWYDSLSQNFDDKEISLNGGGEQTKSLQKFVYQQ